MKILVTGATGGIGTPTCDLLASQGNSLVIASRNEDSLEDLRARICSTYSIPVEKLQIDFSSDESTNNFCDKIRSVGAGLDGVVLIYPRIPKSPDCFSTNQLWLDSFSTAFIRPVQVLKAVSEIIRPRGKIVVLSGISNTQVFPHVGMSNVIRSAWLAQIKTAAFALGRRQIHINTVSLGGTLTEKFRQVHDTLNTESLSGMARSTADIPENIPLGKFGDPLNVAEILMSMLTSFSDHMTGANIVFPDMYATMDHSSGHGGHTLHSDHGGHDENSMHSEGVHGSHAGPKIVETLTVDDLRALEQTDFSKKGTIHNVMLTLGGDMERYIWHFNGKAIHQDRTIEINEGDIVRFTFVNQTMMHHPMHLHGHFFRVLNKSGDHSPLKHTVDVPPHMTRTIEFFANEPGEWMLHCHNLYHLKSGMARVVKYSSYTPRKEIALWQKHDPHLHDHWYFYGMLEAASNHAQGFARASQTWNQFEFRIESANVVGKNFSFADRWDYEGDLFYRRWFNQFFNIIGGATSFGREYRATAGIGYKLPFLIESNLLVNHRGKFRLDLEKRFQWMKNIFTDVDFSWRPAQKGEHEAEFEVSLMYSPAWSLAVGLMVTNDSFGGGVQFQF